MCFQAPSHSSCRGRKREYSSLHYTVTTTMIIIERWPKNDVIEHCRHTTITIPPSLLEATSSPTHFSFSFPPLTLHLPPTNGGKAESNYRKGDEGWIGGGERREREMTPSTYQFNPRELFPPIMLSPPPPPFPTGRASEQVVGSWLLALPLLDNNTPDRDSPLPHHVAHQLHPGIPVTLNQGSATRVS